MLRKLLSKVPKKRENDRVVDEGEAQEFEYTPLPDPGQYIRLIKCHRRLPRTGRSSDEKIACELITVIRTEAPSYRALSYTWGADDARCQILLGGCLFPVTKNLFDFLSANEKRREDSALLWIDAICINQQDQIEKGPKLP
jgi:hypothetical protein